MVLDLVDQAHDHFALAQLERQLGGAQQASFLVARVRGKPGSALESGDGARERASVAGARARGLELVCDLLGRAKSRCGEMPDPAVGLSDEHRCEDGMSSVPVRE
jgi:hypothetical protein